MENKFADKNGILVQKMIWAGLFKPQLTRVSENFDFSFVTFW